MTPSRPDTPYRQNPGDHPVPARPSTLRRDAVVVVVIVLAILSIAHWSDAIEAFATSVLGFPKLP